MDLEIRRLNNNSPDIVEIIDTIKHLIFNETDLSHRSRHEIQKHINKNEVIAMFKNKELVSFLFLTPLNSGAMEIHGMFSVPQYRRHGYMSKLIEYVIATSNKKLLAVTFHDRTEILLSKFDFRKIPFHSLSFSIKLRFLLHRAKVHRLLSIILFLKEKAPVYLFRNN